MRCDAMRACVRDAMMLNECHGPRCAVLRRGLLR
jgi:hypothetical protein